LQTTTNKRNEILYNGLTVAGFGALGAVARYGTGLLGKTISLSFPWGTWMVNMLGCFLLGYLIERWVPLRPYGQRLKLGLTTGFIGSFTTFSAFSVEGVAYLQSFSYGLFIIHLLANVLGGYMLASFGVMLANRDKAVSEQ
jgi:CrcB protein